MTGDLDADQLGRTLVHEHVFTGLPGLELDGRLQLDADSAVERAASWLTAAAGHGVGTVVDATPMNWYRRPDLMRRISERSGVAVVASTGLYTERMGWPFHLKLLRATELADVFTREIEHGMAGTDVRAGMIKIATGQESVGKYERRAIEAAVLAQQRTGAGILTHNEGPTGALQQLEAFTDAGADLSRVLIGYCDNSTAAEYHREIAERGAHVGFDRVGHYTITPDGPRHEAILALLGTHPDRVLLSHDAVAASLGEFFSTEEDPRWEEFGFTLLRQRVAVARELLETTDLPVEQIAGRCGFGSGAGLRRHFTDAVGVSPRSYRSTFRGP
ncbi:Transcriptional regulator, AraC family [Pseudonocardia sp. Ae168_Ps1]|nr:Transcriptional regulator, AraC family [Pseudonocardia sp. Ae168_Ps1]OLL92065.1 Transcriptional regulator, AraC family [Pseudonocardia sp. Ae356_Ps1]